MSNFPLILFTPKAFLSYVEHFPFSIIFQCVEKLHFLQSTIPEAGKALLGVVLTRFTDKPLQVYMLRSAKLLFSNCTKSLQSIKNMTKIYDCQGISDSYSYLLFFRKDHSLEAFGWVKIICEGIWLNLQDSI